MNFIGAFEVPAYIITLAEIEELSTVEVKQKDGGVKKVVDEDLKQSIILKLLEEIPTVLQYGIMRKQLLPVLGSTAPYTIR